MEFDVTVEIPKGQRNKYEVEGAHWAGRAEAAQEIDISWRRARDADTSGGR